MSHRAGRLFVLILAASPWWGAAESHGSDAQGPTVSKSSAAPVGHDASPPRLPIRFAQPARPDENGAPPAESTVPTVARQNPLEVAPDRKPNADAALPLSPPGSSKSSPQRPANPPRAGRTLTTAVGSLGLVLAVFSVFVWFTRRSAPRGLGPLPIEVVESLGRAPLAGRQQIQLVRVGRKLILLAVTPGEARTLTEITDPVEVDRLAGLCQQNRPGSITATFRQVLAQSATDPASRGPRPDDQRLPSDRILRATSRSG